MRFVRSLQHWLGGTGARLQVTDFVPGMHPIRQWADTFPWAALVSASEQSFDKRFPKKSPVVDGPFPSASCAPWSCSSMHWVPPMRISVIACGPTWPSGMPVASETIRAIRPKLTLYCPRPSARFAAAWTRPLTEARIAIQAAAAIDEGLVSPAHLVIDTLPSAQGRPRVTDATTL